MIEERLREAIANLVDYYGLPKSEVYDMLYSDDYPPLESGDLGVYDRGEQNDIFEEGIW